jgi:hypothetical protein
VGQKAAAPREQQTDTPRSKKKPALQQPGAGGGVVKGVQPGKKKVAAQDWNKEALKEVAKMEAELKEGALDSTAKYVLKKKLGTLKAAEKKENLTKEKFQSLTR